jgi:hypothetical protein
MSKHSTIPRFVVGLALTASSAFAGAPLPGFALAAQTTHFAFYSRGARVEAEKSEKFLGTVEKLLGTKLEGQATYYAYRTPEEVEAATGSLAQGVTFTRQREIHSAHGFHAHEIVHLLAGQMGDPGAFFHEGLAVALGNKGRWNGADVDTIAKRTARGLGIRRLIDQFSSIDAQIAFPVAGSFVRSLIRSQGMEKVSGFFKACPQARDREVAFERTFGVSIEQAAADWVENL